MRAYVSLLLGLAAGLGLVFPAQHGCRSATVAAGGASQTAAPADGHEGHQRHPTPTTPLSPDCSCVGNACGMSVGAPLSAPPPVVVRPAVVAAAPVCSAIAWAPTDRAHVLPFANGPPAFLA